MYHVALINETDHEIECAESYKKRDDAIERIRVGLGPQADLNEAGLGTCEAGKVWRVYGPADTAFEWPVDAPDA